MGNSITLTIAVPTFNRCRYLKELIPLLIEQVESLNKKKAVIEILICNNNSTDDTEDFLAPFIKQGLITYRKNTNNIGAERNFVRCIEEASGDYVWIFGDDELLQYNGIENAYTLVANNNFQLIILNDGKYQSKLGDTSFDTLSDFILKMSSINPHFLLAHTLITLNIFKKSVFSLKAAQQNFGTEYSLMYGLMIGMISASNTANAIYISSTPVISIRETRAAVEISHSKLLQKQVNYLRFIAKEFKSAELKRYANRFYLIEFLRLNKNRLYMGLSKIPFLRRFYRALKSK